MMTPEETRARTLVTKLLYSSSVEKDVRVLAAALCEAKTEGMEKVWQSVQEKIHEYHFNVVTGKKSTEAVVYLEDWCREQANALRQAKQES